MTKQEQDQPTFSITLVIFGLAFAFAGFVAFYFIGRDVLATANTYRWKRVPGEIESLSIEYPARAPAGRKNNVFELKADYTYRVDGIPFRGDSLRLKPYRKNNYQVLADHKAKLIASEVSHVFVDPTNANRSILERGSLWPSLALLFPLPFVTIGLACIAGGLGRFSNADKKKKVYSSQSQKNSKSGRFGLFAFGLLFVLVGIGVLIPSLLKPWMRSRRANEWVEVPAEVVWSRVRVHRDEDSNTYSPDILYAYKFDGQTHLSNRYSFFSGSSSGRSSKLKIVNNYPAGKKIDCFVDPDCPRHAVINPSINEIGFWWLIPFIFVVTGGAVVFAGLSKSGKSKSFFNDQNNKNEQQANPRERKTKNASSSFSVDSELPSKWESTSGEGRTFRVGKSRWLGLIGTIFLAAFWNGIAGVIFGQNLLKCFHGKEYDVFMLIFCVPFFLIGLLIIFGVLHAFASLFNPYITLHVRPGAPRTGGELLVSWEVQGGLTRVRQLQISLEGVEEASYRRGTDRLTDEETFYHKRLIDESDQGSIHSGSVIFELPLGLMPTLDLIDNSITWRLSAEGKIAQWSNIFDIHEIEVLPFSMSSKSSSNEEPHA